MRGMKRIYLRSALAVLVQTCLAFRLGGLAYQLPSLEHKLWCFSDGACVATLEQISTSSGTRRRTIKIGRTPDLGDTWADTVVLEDKEAEGMGATLSCVGHDKSRMCVVAWLRSTTGEIMLSKSLDGGISWTEATPVAINGTVPTTQPTIACFVEPQSPEATMQDFSCALIVKRKGPNPFLSAVILKNGTDTLDAIVPLPGFSALEPFEHRVTCQQDASYCVVAFVGCSTEKEVCNTYTSRTTNHGRTWTSPLLLENSNKVEQVRQNPNNTVSISELSVDCAPGTQVCILATDPFTSLPGISKSEQWIELARSEDGGATWSRFELTHSAVGEGFFRRPTVSCSAAPHCVVGWGLLEATFENESPFYRVSNDLGASWEPAQRIQDLPEIIGYRKMEISCGKAVNGCLAVFKMHDSDLLYATMKGFSTSSPQPTLAPTLNAGGKEKTNEEGDEINKTILWMGVVGSASGILLLSGLAVSIYRSKDLGGMAQQAKSFKLSKLSDSDTVYDDSSTVPGSKTPVPPRNKFVSVKNPFSLLGGSTSTTKVQTHPTCTSESSVSFHETL